MTSIQALRPTQDALANLIPSFVNELSRIADWWATIAVDPTGGFHGQIELSLQPVPNARRSIVATARICWFFSRLASMSRALRDQALADRAVRYLLDHFVDQRHAGFFWEVDSAGAVVDDRKHAYGQAFAIYALAAHYEASGDVQALDLARSTFRLIEAQFRDPATGGYGEARSVDWEPVQDQRLSAKDDDAPRSMNTHLHILEAYAELYRVAPEAALGEALSHLVRIHIEQIFDPARGHLKLFWDEQGNDLSRTISYGHDIEASWLIWNAALLLDDADLCDAAFPVVVALAENCLDRGCGPMGELFNELDIGSTELDRTRIWWVQAEGLVGFLNAYQLTGDGRFADQVRAQWAFIEQHVIDRAAGEWRWTSTLDPVPEGAYWAGPWKACYHNGRAMLEMLGRLPSITSEHTS